MPPAAPRSPQPTEPPNHGASPGLLPPRFHREMRAIMGKPGGATLSDFYGRFMRRPTPLLGWRLFLVPAWLAPYAGLAAMIVSEYFTGTGPDDTIPLRLRWYRGDLWRPVAVRAAAIPPEARDAAGV